MYNLFKKLNLLKTKLGLKSDFLYLNSLVFSFTDLQKAKLEMDMSLEHVRGTSQRLFTPCCEEVWEMGKKEPQESSALPNSTILWV